MYASYFGLREPGFSIAPDPQYLYLSEQHREALAHLLYGASESGGFVLLTGEVGTGKTTVCRAFLEQLPDGVDVALILNPALTADELLLTICEEFRIPVPPDERSIKRLIDRLNRYLLDAHAQGRRPLVIIDEAQNLGPSVMEQVRLLTNLETTRHKLLQIFLVGQPELRDLLATDALRQIDQRITARVHLRPLTPRETADYIRHRIAVAGVERPLFTAAALRRVHRFSGGIPRLINILCDRALLGACVTRVSQVTPDIVERAAREIRGGAPARRPGGRWWQARPLFIGALALTLALALGLALVTPMPAGWLPDWLPAGTMPAGITPEPPPGPAATTEPSAPSEPDPIPAASPAETALPAPPSTPVSDPVSDLPEPPTLEVPAGRLAIPEAEGLRILLRRWGVTVETLGDGDPCRRVAELGLRCLRGRGTLPEIRDLDRPLLLRVGDRDGRAAFLALGALDGALGTLEAATGRARVPLTAIEALWTGEYTLIWQPPPSKRTAIGPGASAEDVRWLRRLLAAVPDGGLAPGDAPVFDAPLASAVRAFQSARGLGSDGLAGPRTLIQLDNAARLPGTPRLTASGPENTAP